MARAVPAAGAVFAWLHQRDRSRDAGEADEMLKRLVGIGYRRNDIEPDYGTFRARGDTVEVRSAVEEKVLRMRFGIDMNTDHTLEEVGKQFDVTRERIRQIEAKALRKLRHPTRSEQLRSFLDLE